MCGIIGIAGINSEKITKAETDAMLKTLSCRGPDDTGIEHFSSCMLGQTRLSIIDLGGGHQPMKDITKNLTITFNGEIYNYQELKKDLESKGHVFSTNSDTEVILKAYAEYGSECPKYLDGMFAFALWDEDTKTLFMARDRFGKKPLYYCFDTYGNLCFASEIKALIAEGHVTPKISMKAVHDFLSLMYVLPTETIYENIFTVLPSESISWNNSKLSKNIYWKLEYNPLSVSNDEAKTEVKKLITDAVRKRMIADVEVGSLLSGGVDSTLVSYLAQTFLPKPIKTFSLGYGDYINELPYAKQAAEKIGSDHYTLQASDNQIDELEKVISYFDEPHADSSNFPQHLVSKLASSKVKVALSGDGADELFMGYGWYWKYWSMGMKEKVQNIFTSQFGLYAKNAQIFSESELKKLLKASSFVSYDVIPDAIQNSSEPDIVKINRFDLTTYLPGQLLSKVDRTSMMNSLEVRSPFLDYKLAEYVFNLPVEFKTDRKNGKLILKDILAEIMPKDFVYRRKQGFGAPVLHWLKQESFKKTIYEKLYSNARIFSICNEAYIKNLVDSFYVTKNEKEFYKIWVLLCLELWYRSHIHN